MLLVARSAAGVGPEPALRRTASTGDALATVIFSSGSTGIPKGVMLTHRNILANVDAIGQVYELTADDVLLGVLPFFHSFGFTGTLWLPALSGFGVVYHPNPMDAKTIGELAGQYRATLIISTPTFCSSYVRKCEPEQFEHLRYAIVGAERLREPVAAAFKEKFGVDLLEGYGCTEMAPVVAVNVPTSRTAVSGSEGRASGRSDIRCPASRRRSSIPTTGKGRCSTGRACCSSRDRTGCWAISASPKRPPRSFATAGTSPATSRRSTRRGSCGSPIASSRFSKIAGEMVPHMRVEEQIQALVSDHCRAVVTSVPDESKGERLVAFYTDPGPHAAPALGAAVPDRASRACGSPSEKTCTSSNRSRRSAPAKSTCAACGSSRSNARHRRCNHSRL